MNILTFDLETGTVAKHGRKGNFKYNDIIAIGLKYYDYGLNEQDLGRVTGGPYGFVWKELQKTSFLNSWLTSVDILVGHNIKFDLLYIWDRLELQEWFRNGGRIWDTQLAHYILSGQQETYPALRDIAVRCYGLKQREKKMEMYWDEKTTKILKNNTKEIIQWFPFKTPNEEIAKWCDKNQVPAVDVIHGHIDTKDIPIDIVKEDVKNDVCDTEEIFFQQIKQAKDKGMLSLIQEQMDGLLATTEIEYNGMFVDREELVKNKQGIENKLEEKKKEFMNLIESYWRIL